MRHKLLKFYPNCAILNHLKNRSLMKLSINISIEPSTLYLNFRRTETDFFYKTTYFLCFLHLQSILKIKNIQYMFTAILNKKGKLKRILNTIKD